MGTLEPPRQPNGGSPGPNARVPVATKIQVNGSESQTMPHVGLSCFWSYLGPSSLHSLSVCIFYATVSTTLSLCNKLILSSYDFKYTFILMALQASFTVLFITTVMQLRHLGWALLTLPETQPFSLAKLLNAGSLILVNVANVACGFYGMRAIAVPLFLCFRRTGAAFVLLTEYLASSSKPQATICVAVGLTCVGAFIAGAPAMHSNWLGIIWMLGNNTFTALSLTMQRRYCDSNKTSTFGLLLYTSLGTAPVALVMAIAVGEVDSIPYFPHLLDPTFLLALFISVSLGVLITYAIALCATVNSPMATTVTGNAKDIVCTACGWVMFGGFDSSLRNVAGLTVSFVGAGLFSWTKLQTALQTDRITIESPSRAEKL